MKKWEDIFKDKLGGMIITLPERSLVEFRSRLDGTEGSSPAKQFTFWWVMAIPVAAGLAAILILSNPAVPENDIQIIRQPDTPVTEASESTDVSETTPSQMLIVQAFIPKPDVNPATYSPEHRTEENPVENEETVSDKPTTDYPVGIEAQDTSTPETQDGKTIDNPVEETSSPFIPNNYGTKNLLLKVGPAVGIVGGGSLLAAIITTTIGSSKSIPMPRHGDGSAQQNEYSHSFPLILGISTKIPITNELFLTSGLDYSVYSTKYTYSFSGEKNQVVRYLGIPVCLDLSIASTRWFDVYVGGGLQGDYCINASRADTSIKKDGLSLSIIGSGGIQFNIIPQLGLYVEPEISYLIPSQSYRLETYRTDSPLVFSVKSGLRITISNKALFDNFF